MKNLLFPLLLLLASLPALTAQELTVRRVYGDYLFAQNNEIVTMRELIASLPAASESRQLLKSSRFYTVSSVVLGISAGATLGAVLSGVLLPREENQESDLWVLGAVGVASYALSVPLNRSGDRRIKQAIELYI